MKYNSKFIKFFIFLATVLLDISIVNAADLSSTYAPGNCNTTNPYWGMHDEYYINPNITLGVDVPLSSSDLDGIGNNLNANISTRFMYDIISMSVGSDDVLAVTGWAFNTTDERTGSGANAYQNLQFQLVAIDGSGTIPITDVRAGGSYNTKQWLCKRTQADKYTIKGSAGNFNWYKTAGECKVGSKAWGGTGFTVYIDLKNANLKADKSYKLQMQYSGRGSSGWQDVTAAKGIADTVKSYTSRSTDGLDVKITGGTDKVKVHSDGTPVGQNGLVCTLWHDKTPKEMMSIHFSGGEYTYTGAKRTAELNVGDGAMNMYQVQISDNGSPGTSRTAYAAAVWTEFASDGVIKIEIGKSKPITPGDAQVSDAKCEGKDTYEFYYLFLATVEDSYANTMVTSADGAKFNDALILENDLQFTNISVTSQGEYKIDSSNLQTYYTWLQKALKGPSRYAKEGESTYYIAYDSWCSIDQRTNKVRYCREAATGKAFNVAAGVNPGPGEPWMNGGNFNLSEAVAATTVTDRGQSIRASKRSNNKGYQFNLERGFDAHTGGRPAMMGGTTRTVSSRFTDQEGAKQVSYHPMAYKITFCESEPGDCDDDVNQAVCPSGDSPAGAVFHENDDLKTCTIPKENSSGFTAVEKEDTSTLHKADGYCEVACKEDLDIDLPGHKETAAGQYFKLDNYIPKIKAKRTCVTTSVDYKHFDDDLKAYEKDLIKYYNIWQDYKAMYEFLMKVETYEVNDTFDEDCEPCDPDTGVCTHIYAEYTGDYWKHEAFNPPNTRETGLKLDADDGEESRTCDYDCDGPIACDDELTQKREEYRIKTHNAYAMYHNTYIDYMETINAYNKCFNWTDSTKNVYMNGGGDPFGEGPEIVPYDFDDYYTYMYKFKPTVSFYYPDRDGAVFPVAYTYDYSNGQDVVGKGFGLGGMPDTKTNYWNKDSGEIDKNYESGGTSKGGSGNRHIGENQEDRKLIQCEGKTCSTASISVDSKFYTSKYLRRDEEVEYEYHLPRVYTKVPSGIVSTEDRLANNATWLKLDAEAVPVNINTEAGTYDYNITIRDIVNAADQDIRAETKGKNPDDNFQERFNGATGNGALNDGENYVCDYDVINDAYIPDPSKYNFFYRTIDPYDINPVKRTLGYNWNDERGRYIQDKMAEAEDDYQVLTSREKFVFTLTPSLMKAVRDYNKTKSNNSDGGYADWDMVCKDYGEGGYHCYSNFLSCMASGGTMPEAGTGLSCSLFGDSLNDYLSDYSDYDWSDLDENRRALIQKQNEIDWSLGHAKNVSE